MPKPNLATQLEDDLDVYRIEVTTLKLGGPNSAQTILTTQNQQTENNDDSILAPTSEFSRGARSHQDDRSTRAA